ncbi:MAG: membrane dipeptidase [Clostridiaceae bacterium]|nr:membrane dipeptidase [Clostridiaceae bacterium]
MNYFDLHCDTIFECYETGKSLRENDLMIDREKVSRYGHYAQFFALFCGAKAPEGVVRTRVLLDLPPEARLDALLAEAKRQFRENADWLMHCYTAEDFDYARAKGKAAAFLSIEGAELLATDAHVARAYDAGVRLVTLSWNYRNAYACGAAADNDAELTVQGRELVHQLVQLGMILDVSHLSEGGFWDLCVQTEAPFVASHSNSRAECTHLRNLTDLQFSEIVRRGGLCGINLYSPFLRDDGQHATLDDALRHIEHLMACGGEACLALGCDFDGCDTLPVGMEGARDMENLAEVLLRHNYLESTVNALFYDNAAAFIHRML